MTTANGNKRLCYLHVLIMSILKPESAEGHRCVVFLDGYDLSLDNMVWSNQKSNQIQVKKFTIHNPGKRAMHIGTIGELSRASGLSKVQVWDIVIDGYTHKGWRSPNARLDVLESVA